MELTPRGSSFNSEGGELVPKELPAFDIVNGLCLEAAMSEISSVMSPWGRTQLLDVV